MFKIGDRVRWRHGTFDINGIVIKNQVRGRNVRIALQTHNINSSKLNLPYEHSALAKSLILIKPANFITQFAKNKPELE